LGEERKLAIGVDLGGTNIKGGVVDQNGQILRRLSVQTQAQEGPERILDQIARLVQELKGERGIEGVGVGCPGLVEPTLGVVRDPPNLAGWQEVNVKRELEERLELRVEVANDVNAAALGELYFGAGRGVSNFICITLGTGVGGGLILDGKLFTGSRGVAGEIGHLPVNIFGPRCRCGNYGCLERYVGAEYIVERAQKKLKDNPASLLSSLEGELTPKLIAQAAQKGDKLAKEVFRETGEIIGAALSGAVNLLNPELIIVGGGVAQAGELVLEPIRRTLVERAMNRESQGVKVVPALLEEDAGLIGAGSLILKP